MRRNAIRRLHLTLLLLLAFVCATLAVCLISRSAPSAVASAAESEAVAELAQKETEIKEETHPNGVVYQALERVDYANTASYEPNPERTHYQGIMGKTAVGRIGDGVNTPYQLYFDNCFETKKEYEISFYAKSVNSANDFYVEVTYTSKNDLTSNKELPKLETVDGEWTKYSFTFTSDKNLSTCFKLTVAPKNRADEVYFDRFSAVQVDDGYAPLLCGEQFTPADWTEGAEQGELVSFNGENYPAALKSYGGTLTSKMLEVPESGMLRLRFVLQKTTGASVRLLIRNALGETLEEVALTGSFSYYDFVTPNLTEYSFVFLCVEITCADNTDYAVIGALEAVEHVHDLTLQPQDYPKYDFANCATTYLCNTCNLEVKLVAHELATEREASCYQVGKRVCQNELCGLTVELPMTAHTYAQHCSKENAGKAFNCTVCGAGRVRMLSAHDLVARSLSNTEHISVCSVCAYEGEAEQHALDDVKILNAPTAEKKGYALIDCASCKQKHGLDLPCIEEGSAAWSHRVVKVENCLETGLIRYVLKAMEGLFVDVSTEALGHSYEEIKAMPTCTEDGVSLHHRCKECGYTHEKETEIAVLTAYGHELTEWEVETEPTLESDGLRKRYCNRCQELVEEEVIPKLDEVNYVKYALDDHDEKKGFYYYYENEEYGRYKVFVEGVNEDKAVILTVCISCAVVVIGSVAAYCLVAAKSRKKKE